MMRIKLNQPYLSIKSLNEIDLPDFTMLIGRNGVGKTHLLGAIESGSVAVSDISSSGVEMYNLESFRLEDSQPADREISSLVARTIEKYFTKGPDLALVEVAKNIFEEIIDSFGLTDASDDRRQFEEELKIQRPPTEVGGLVGGLKVP